ncbi:MAG: 3-deoxy-7-phosphoheptulonate synthase [Parachlamydiales bacterium]|nr:3-deoxy-7-phosphoheptulonate synthase [Parachlamydiales bacterium]
MIFQSVEEKKFPAPDIIKKVLPLPQNDSLKIHAFRCKAQSHFFTENKKTILFVGPCSIHDTNSFFLYAQKLFSLQKRVKNFFIILRFYPEKARTKKSWKGFLYDPYLDGSDAMEEGLLQARSLLLQITRIGLPCCMEFVSPYFIPYLDDMITWGFIGARTVCSQIHRLIASSLNIPIGFKNSLDGTIETALDAVETSRENHTFLSMNSSGELVKTRSSGNPFTHIVLRGGNTKTNYDPHSIEKTMETMKKMNIESPLAIDCAHGNSHKDLEKQKKCFLHTIKTMVHYPSYPIKGIMLESNILEGKQNHSSSIRWGLSLTDPCLGWSSTEKLILWADDFLSKEISFVHS